MRKLRNFYLVVAVLAMLCIGQEASAQASISPPVGVQTNVANTWTGQQTFSLEDSGTTTTLYPIQLVRTTTGAASTALGVGNQYALENSTGTTKIAGTDEVVWSDATATTEDADYVIKLMAAGAAVAEFFRFGSDGLVTIPATGNYTWSTRARLTSPVNGVVGVTGSGGTGGYMQNTGGDTALSGNYTNATAVFSNTNLSRTVISGRGYAFDVSLYITSSAPTTDGWKLDFAGGSATATAFVANCFSINELGAIQVLVNGTSAALATVINSTDTATSGQQLIECHGTFFPSSTGTFILRGGQDVDGGATFTIKAGSNMNMRDVTAQ